MRILIDGDGCPVVDIAVRLAKKNSLECIIFCDTSHYFNKEGATTITVSKGSDSVDFALLNKINVGDIVITQDYGLAAMCLAKRANVISQNGIIFNDDNINQLLDQRYVSKKLRDMGKRTKGESKRSKAQDINFENVMKELILNCCKKA